MLTLMSVTAGNLPAKGAIGRKAGRGTMVPNACFVVLCTERSRLNTRADALHQKSIEKVNESGEVPNHWRIDSKL